MRRKLLDAAVTVGATRQTSSSEPSTAWLGSATIPAAFPAVRRKSQPTSRLVTCLEQLRQTLRPTPHVPLAMPGMRLFAKLEYINPVGSIKDRPAFWILKR